MMLNLPVEVIVSVTLASHCNSPELYISAMIDSIELLIIDSYWFFRSGSVICLD